MSQTRIRVPQTNQDWMMELQHDAQQFQAVVERVDQLADMALRNLANGDKVDAGLRLMEIREGLNLICELAGIKRNATAQS